MQLIYYINQDVPLTASPLDNGGSAISGGSVTASVVVTDPAGTATTLAGSATSGGAFGAVVDTVSSAGIWLYSWTATGTNGNGEDVQWVAEGQFQVRAAGIEQLVDLASVKAHLGLSASDTRKDDALQGFILAAGDLARDFCGPFLPESHTQWFDGGSSALVLDWLPLLTVQSCTEYYGLSAFAITEQPLGGQMNAFGFTADYETGQLTRRTFGGEAAYWARGMKNIKVVYTAGRAEDVPYTIRLGALELIRHIWQMTQQGGRPQFGGSALDGADGPPVLTGFALPARVRELWAPLRRPPGIA